MATMSLNLVSPANEATDVSQTQQLLLEYVGDLLPWEFWVNGEKVVEYPQGSLWDELVTPSQCGWLGGEWPDNTEITWYVRYANHADTKTWNGTAWEFTGLTYDVTPTRTFTTIDFVESGIRSVILNGNNPEVGNQYGTNVIGVGWEARMEILSVSDTGDGGDKKVCEYLAIYSPSYGAYKGGSATLYTSDSSSRCTFSNIPDTIALAGYVRDSESNGIDGVIVSTDGGSDDTSFSGYWQFDIACPFTGVLTPSKSGYTFVPETISLTNRYFNVTTNNFVGSEVISLFKPVNPAPLNNATNVDFTDLTLTWEDGGGATSYDVYIGNNVTQTLVSEGQAGTSYITTMEELRDVVGTSLNEKIYWRIDAVNDEGTTTGDIWNFDPRPGQVTVTTPENEATGIKLHETSVGWEEPDGQIQSYDIYYGTLSGFLEYVGSVNAGEELLIPLIVGDWPNYAKFRYFRIDTVNEFGVTQGNETYFSNILFNPPLPSGLTFSGDPTDENNGISGTPSGENNVYTVRRVIACAKNTLYFEEK